MSIFSTRPDPAPQEPGQESAWEYPRPPRLDDEPAIAQPGDFYGGWITKDVVGPFKGGPGTRGW